MIARSFIDRPILSSVIAIIIFLTGLISMNLLPVEQFPNILPPQINVQASYAGANAETVANSIAAPIEQQVNTVENIIYMYSNCSSSGDYGLNIFFNIGYNVEQALIDVENKVNNATPQLPDEVQKSGVKVLKQTPAFLQVIALQSPEGRYDEIFLSNYASINIVDDLQRTPGVSSVKIINDRTYAMRIWLDPNLLAKYKLTTNDVANAIRDQNTEYSVGRLGELPTKTPVELTLSLRTTDRLSTPDEFNNIIVKSNPDGSIIYIKDLGYAELGAQSYNVQSKLDGIPSIAIAIYQQFDANALQVAREIQEKMKQISKNFPIGMEYSIPYDTTRFVKASIQEVVKTIFEAAILVSLVVLVFLQNIRITLVPVQAMVISIVGTFAGLLALGLSINTLTLFALVLSIGIVVDDAIVVIENVERNMRLTGQSGKESAYKAMGEVSGPIIAIVLVLCSVFLPVAFLGGISGELYKQFGLTISISVLISGLVALTLSPALSAIIIHKIPEPNRFSKAFNHSFDRLTHHYLRVARSLIVNPLLGGLIFITMCLAALFLFFHVPTGFIPLEDQGRLITVVNMPEGTSLPRTEKTMDEVQQIALKDPAVEHFFDLIGYSFLNQLNVTNQGVGFAILTDWSIRHAKDLRAPAIFRRLSNQYQEIPEGQIFLFNPPSIQGLGSVGGFEFWIENRGNENYSYLEQVTQKMIEKASLRPEIGNLITTIKSDAQQIFIDIDRAKARVLQVPISDIYATLQSLFGSFYVNNFNKFGRVYRVMIMAESEFRKMPSDIEDVYVRSMQGKMIPLSSLVNLKNASGPTIVSRFNAFPAAKINGDAAAGYSSGQAIAAMEEVAKEYLPEDMAYSWASESYQEKQAHGSASKMLIGGLLMIFLILAALYEKWTAPFAILLAVPFGIFGALTSIWLLHRNNDIYFQIGLITVIALSAKNGILIVEFALIKMKEGMSLLDAAIEAGRLRLRAILMTSLTFIFGAIPLIISSGAGANSRISLGIGVIGGMSSATFLAVFFIPLFFFLIMKYFARVKESQI